MSTENEGAAVPADRSAPSAPPAPPAPPVPPAAAPGASPAQAAEPAAGPAAEPMAEPQAPHTSPAPAASEPAASEPVTAAQEPLHTPPAAAASTPAPAAAGAGWPPAPPVTPAWASPLPPAPEAPRKRGGLVAAVLVAALVAGGVGGGVGYWAASERDSGTTTSTTISSSDSPASFKRDPGTVAAVAAKALPSVVTIQAKSGGVEGEGGTGTGFVYDKEGHIVTNNHVVASAAEGGGTLSATFSDGKSYDAEVVGRAEGYDVAVLKLKNAPSNLAPLPLGDSDKVAVGDSTIAIGAPFGLSNTVTTGIISAKDRSVASGDGSGGKNSYMSALQTDASINPGNSGGPLLDASGAVIGINSAIQSAGSGFGQSQAGSIGLGFAIPVNQAKNVAEQLIKTGKPVYPVIGATVNMQDKGEGATIAEQGSGGTPAVAPDGPAAKAGLKPGDVITGFDDRQIDSGPTLISEIWTHKPGDTVKITYERDGKPATVTLTLGERTGDN
ncbi:S1C family serine protease [Streptomyces roseoviridis]|uniref:S1C family serine protease n=1 Tax=Streptomyces roseoviridis TaxID=67361 RepID=A0ABV5QL42_9ACTN